MPLDILAFALCPALALLLRLDGHLTAPRLLQATEVYAAIAVVVRTAIFLFAGMYRRYWRYAAAEDVVLCVFSVLASEAAVTLCYFLGRVASVIPYHLPRTLPIVDCLLVLAATAGTRLCVRLAHHWQYVTSHTHEKRVLLIGARQQAHALVQEMRERTALGWLPVGYLDDEVKAGIRVLGLPVLGGVGDLCDTLKRARIQQVVVAQPELTGKDLRRLVAICEQEGVPVKTMPTLSAILADHVHVHHLREIQIEDLLRREPVKTDISAVGALVRGRRVLITGAGGSIGSELCRQVLAFGPASLALLGHGENSIFEIDNELKRLATEGEHETVLRAYIADIRIPERILTIIKEFRPEIIFHAAAHKHVPLMEANPTEAISNNVLGTRNVLNAALAVGTEHFVMISTDKVVNPTSVMGASKRIAEMLVLKAARQSGRNYVAVRFGNVLGSRGSVVPIFKRQVAEGGPITVSHPDMRRFFMTIPEAVQLVLQAAVLGHGGEVFMLDMGEPVRIVDLARDLITLSGYKPDEDIEIAFTGIRPGEKLFEELFLPGEVYAPTRHPKIRIVGNASAFVPAILDETITAFEQAVVNDEPASVIDSLRLLIPEFTPDQRWCKRPAVSAMIGMKETTVA